MSCGVSLVRDSSESVERMFLLPPTEFRINIKMISGETNMKVEDYEDGELPEDGEIEDEDEQIIKDNDRIDVKPTYVVSKKIGSPPSEAPLVGSTSVPPRKPVPKGYGDDMGFSTKDWPSDVAHTESERSNEGDKDYRFEDDFGDSDYRQGPPGRRRRMSPSYDQDYDCRYGKRPLGGPRPFRSFKKPKWATEHQICKFFREGYCRDGDECTYSHQAEDSLRKPEICRFYQQGFCKKGLTCLQLHGEFPCKAFHKGECSRNPCQFSHQPLTDYTRPLFERMRTQEEDISKFHNRNHHFPAPAVPNHLQGLRRPPLLPPPPVNNVPSVNNVAAAPVIHASVPQPSNGHLPPPSVVVPTLTSSLPLLPPQVLRPNVSMNADTSPRQDDLKSRSSPHFDITQMLAQIAGNTGTSISDSPASPPMYASSINDIRSIPSTLDIIWRLIPIEKSPPYHGIDPSCASKTDPRIARVIASQFDAVSSLFSHDESRQSNVRDPRRRPQESKSDVPMGTSWMPQIA